MKSAIGMWRLKQKTKKKKNTKPFFLIYNLIVGAWENGEPCSSIAPPTISRDIMYCFPNPLFIRIVYELSWLKINLIMFPNIKFILVNKLDLTKISLGQIRACKCLRLTNNFNKKPPTNKPPAKIRGCLMAHWCSEGSTPLMSKR